MHIYAEPPYINLDALDSLIKYVMHPNNYKSNDPIVYHFTDTGGKAWVATFNIRVDRA